MAKNKDLSGLLFCPHDLTHSPEFRDDLPTLFSINSITTNTNAAETKLGVAKRSSCSAFDTPETSEVRSFLSICAASFREVYLRYI